MVNFFNFFPHFSFLQFIYSRKNSFNSLFGLFMADKCPLFYCEFPKFTIMFKGPSVGGVNDHMIIMSTSARRIRDTFDNLSKQHFNLMYCILLFSNFLEITYKMPFLKKNLKSTNLFDSIDMKSLKKMESKIPDQM